VRLTIDEKNSLKEIASEYKIPYSKLITSLIEGEKSLFINFQFLNEKKEIQSNFRIAKNLDDALKILEVIKSRGEKITFVGWLVKIKKGKFSELDMFL
jgi:hypothetical protein